jgi:hypothetical protein
MLPRLTARQRRVLGTLVEKSLATPGSYPLSLNALVAGCSQLSCREPVMKMDEGETLEALEELIQHGLAAEVAAQVGSRVERFRHLLRDKCGWEPREQAIVAELLLRGPQTLGELKTNASRMAPIGDLESASAIVTAFAQQTPPVVRELPRQPGKSVVRYDHLFYVDGETTAPAGRAPEPAAGSLEERVAALELDVAILRKEILALREERKQP